MIVHAQESRASFQSVWAYYDSCMSNRWASRGEIMKTWLVFLALVLTGCASTGVVPMDKDTYMVAKRSAQFGFGPADGVKADVYRRQTTFARK